MKRIIRNRTYDTDTATSIGEWENIRDVCDATYVCETLYIKRNGEYFLHGWGGPMTRYSHIVNDSTWTGGERITPLTYEQARRWAEEHLRAEEYMRAFEVVDDASEVVLSIRVSATAKAKLDRMAAQTGRSKSSILTELLEQCE